MINSITAMIYDRQEGKGTLRLSKNVAAIKSAADGLDLKLIQISRATPFPGEPMVEDVLLKDGSFPFDVVIISTDGYKAETVLETAKIALELHDLPMDRIICIVPLHSSPPVEQGMRHIYAKGGNGHLTPDNAKELVRALCELSGYKT